MSMGMGSGGSGQLPIQPDVARRKGRPGEGEGGAGARGVARRLRGGVDEEVQAFLLVAAREEEEREFVFRPAEFPARRRVLRDRRWLGAEREDAEFFGREPAAQRGGLLIARGEDRVGPVDG